MTETGRMAVFHGAGKPFEIREYPGAFTQVYAGLDIAALRAGQIVVVQGAGGLGVLRLRGGAGDGRRHGC